MILRHFRTAERHFGAAVRHFGAAVRHFGAVVRRFGAVVRRFSAGTHGWARLSLGRHPEAVALWNASGGDVGRGAEEGAGFVAAEAGKGGLIEADPVVQGPDLAVVGATAEVEVDARGCHPVGELGLERQEQDGRVRVSAVQGPASWARWPAGGVCHPHRHPGSCRHGRSPD
ncbi:hypothetical protein [Streptomyces sp. Act143]|uniref:hypothetical protein n=1 Tax=Streptomyces sp. Act143 TaxID=2200760 RepID=UPI0015E7FEE7|nr:hypothetical protein [Streptomyces sp. Act143]